MKPRSTRTVSKRKTLQAKSTLTETQVLTIWLALAFCVSLFIYAPALFGPFVFDDRVQIYALPEFAEKSLRHWVAGLRPLLFFTYWLNHKLLGDQPFGYHLVNIVIHVLNSGLVFFVSYKLLRRYRGGDTPRRLQWLAGFVSSVFLLHPIQTESVAYIASRSETLCAFFMLAALALFLARLGPPITWPTALGIVLLLLAGCATKEQAVALAPVLLLTDLFWNGEFSLQTVRRNWRLYLLLAVGGLAGGAVALIVLSRSTSAGFELQGINWIQYFFTECRVLFYYIGLFILPVGQTVEHEIHISKTILDYGSVLGVMGLAALIAAAVHFRRRYRLASFGILTFVILLAPTSSFVPLLDPMVEHRLYLPVFALTLVLMEFLLRPGMDRRQLVAICVVLPCIYAAISLPRNKVWSSEIALWHDAVSKSPDEVRPYTNLAAAYIAQHRCAEAEQMLQQSSTRFAANYRLLTAQGRAAECLAKFDEAARLIGKAAELRPRAPLYLEIGLMRARQGKAPEAYDAFQRAIQLDPNDRQAYILRGDWYEAADRFDLAIKDFERALALMPDNAVLRDHLAELKRRLGLSAERH
jgi:tetratricopeptide (TPR) repeat protein